MVKKEIKKISKLENLKEELEILLENFPLKKFVVVVFSVGFLFLLTGLFLIFFLKPYCGDGTLYGQCSKNKPYFCSEGVLVEKASSCGCNSNLTLTGNLCISKYQLESKEATFKYILRGEEKEINLTLYKEMANYLSSLPSSISPKKGENFSRADFKFRAINNEEQRNLLMPLVIKIQNIAKDKTEQMRIAVSLVQKIPFEGSKKTFLFGNTVLNYSRYPYEILYEKQGICEEKSQLLVFLLRELGYKSVIFFNIFENHESVGIKCPMAIDFKNTGYCFVETTASSIITDDEVEYVGVGGLYSTPEVALISEGISLGRNLYEYKDANDLKVIRNTINENGQLSSFQHQRFEELKKKYGLERV
ncbi:MAG: hypothetical protein Q7S06_03015 [Nanoarchaeota archaeon]|nr:hypothetical protein [Nanoarchaeota archaeon]